MKNGRYYITSVILLGLMLTSTFAVFRVYALATPWVGYVKPSYPDYAPSGMPDFDEKQPQFTTDQGHVQYSWCVPVAVADSLWWLDSKYESKNYTNPVPPPTVSDHFNLVTAYGQWDDHDPQNVFGLVAELAGNMHTDGIGVGGGYVGTRYADIQPGINTYLTNHGVAGLFEVHGADFPVFSWIDQQVEACQDVELCLEFWYFTGQNWQPVTNPIFELGHCVTCAGVNSTTSQVLVSDPYYNAFEAGLVPGRSPVPHTDLTTAVHNNATLVSQDAYNVVQFPIPPPPGYPIGVLELQNYLQINGFTIDPNWHAFIRGAVAVSPVPTHDVAVTNVTTSKTGCTPMPTVGQNMTMTVNVTVADTGDFDESNITVTAFAAPSMPPSIAIGQVNVSLTAGSSANLTLTWNTTGASYGSYTISATAGPVAGETYTGDNTLSDGTTLVTIPGDINGDGKVGLSDLSILAKAYGTTPGSPKWVANADLNGDGKVGLSDLSILAKHYGQHYP
ncbi:MAG: dockerin type I domain-containing protein [Candidatus Bathyarchaeia archaeon]